MDSVGDRYELALMFINSAGERIDLHRCANCGVLIAPDQQGTHDNHHSRLDMIDRDASNAMRSVLGDG